MRSTRDIRVPEADSRLDDLYARSIGLEANRGFLLPVCELHVADEALIELSRGLARGESGRLPDPVPSDRRRHGRLASNPPAGCPDRILFVVMDAHGNRVGHVGLADALNDANEVDVDNVVRGVTGVRPGIMSSALQALLDWTEEHLAPSTIALRVFEDNVHAIAFYRRLGFVDDGLLPLRRRESGAAIAFEPAEATDAADPDAFFLRMVYRPRRAVDASRMIPTAGPSISAREASYALDAVAQRLEPAVGTATSSDSSAPSREYLGVRHAIADLELHRRAASRRWLALGVGPGDEVIVPDLTWVATASAVAYLGATRSSWMSSRRTLVHGPVCLRGRDHSAAPSAVIPGPPLWPSGADGARSSRSRAEHGIAGGRGRRAGHRRRRLASRKVGTFGDARRLSASRAPSCWSPARAACWSRTSDDLYERIVSLLWTTAAIRTGEFWINATRVQVQDVQRAGGHRTRTARTRGRADRSEAPCVRLVRRGARRRRRTLR